MEWFVQMNKCISDMYIMYNKNLWYFIENNADANLSLKLNWNII